MSTMMSESFAPIRHGQELLDDVVSLFVDLLVAGGATSSMIDLALAKALAGVTSINTRTVFMELGALQRDCMEVMCRWRRDIALVDVDGEPLPLDPFKGQQSLDALCKKVPCKNDSSVILKALLDFGAVSTCADGRIRSETPTFLLGRASGGLLATDGLLKQLEGYLSVVHRNVRSVAGPERPKFERACTVSIASELEPVFDRLVRQRGQEFVDSVDEWLERNARHESTSGQYLELGAGAYYIGRGGRSTPSRR
jgi:hypothetical protein